MWMVAERWRTSCQTTCNKYLILNKGHEWNASQLPFSKYNTDIWSFVFTAHPTHRRWRVPQQRVNSGTCDQTTPVWMGPLTPITPGKPHRHRSLSCSITRLMNRHVSFSANWERTTPAAGTFHVINWFIKSWRVLHSPHIFCIHSLLGSAYFSTHDWEVHAILLYSILTSLITGTVPVCLIILSFFLGFKGSY